MFRLGPVEKSLSSIYGKTYCLSLLNDFTLSDNVTLPIEANHNNIDIQIPIFSAIRNTFDGNQMVRLKIKYSNRRKQIRPSRLFTRRRMILASAEAHRNPRLGSIVQRQAGECISKAHKFQEAQDGTPNRKCHSAPLNSTTSASYIEQLQTEFRDDMILNYTSGDELSTHRCENQTNKSDGSSLLSDRFIHKRGGPQRTHTLKRSIAHDSENGIINEPCSQKRLKCMDSSDSQHTDSMCHDITNVSKIDGGYNEYCDDPSSSSDEHSCFPLDLTDIEHKSSHKWTNQTNMANTDTNLLSTNTDYLLFPEHLLNRLAKGANTLKGCKDSVTLENDHKQMFNRTVGDIKSFDLYHVEDRPREGCRLQSDVDDGHLEDTDEVVVSESSHADDFCEVCQKHFCNKYYLRKHRADVHGIYSDYVRPKKPQSDPSKSSDISNEYNDHHVIEEPPRRIYPLQLDSCRAQLRKRMILAGPLQTSTLTNIYDDDSTTRRPPSQSNRHPHQQSPFDGDNNFERACQYVDDKNLGYLSEKNDKNEGKCIEQRCPIKTMSSNYGWKSNGIRSNTHNSNFVNVDCYSSSPFAVCTLCREEFQTEADFQAHIEAHTADACSNGKSSGSTPTSPSAAGVHHTNGRKKIQIDGKSTKLFKQHPNSDSTSNEDKTRLYRLRPSNSEQQEQKNMPGTNVQKQLDLVNRGGHVQESSSSDLLDEGGCSDEQVYAMNLTTLKNANMSSANSDYDHFKIDSTALRKPATEESEHPISSSLMDVAINLSSSSLLCAVDCSKPSSELGNYDMGSIKSEKQDIHFADSSVIPSSRNTAVNLSSRKLSSASVRSATPTKSFVQQHHAFSAGHSSQPQAHAKPSERVVCDICNKEVCNKYFLKTHKTRVHGIVFEAVKPTESNSNYVIKHDQQYTTKTPFGNSTACRLIRSTTSTVNTDTECKTENESTISYPNRTHSTLSSSATERCEAFLTNEIFRENLFSPRSQNSLTDQHPSQLSNLSTALSRERRSGDDTSDTHNERPSSIEIQNQLAIGEDEKLCLSQQNIDPEKFCGFCKKGFCSKYLLKVHLYKTHASQDGTVSGNSLIDRHSTTTASLTDELIHAQALLRGHSSSPSQLPQLSQPNNVIKRGSCRRENSAVSTSSASASAKPKSLSPAQTRVTCQICKKELCNKYFLRSHMMNVHNIFADESINCHTSQSSGHINSKCSSSTNSLSKFEQNLNAFTSSSASTNLPLLLSSDQRKHCSSTRSPDSGSVTYTNSIAAQRPENPLLPSPPLPMKALADRPPTATVADLNNYNQLLLNTYAQFHHMLAAAQIVNRSMNNSLSNSNDTILKNSERTINQPESTRSDYRSEIDDLQQYRCALCADHFNSHTDYVAHCQKMHKRSLDDVNIRSTNQTKNNTKSKLPSASLRPPKRSFIDQNNSTLNTSNDQHSQPIQLDETKGSFMSKSTQLENAIFNSPPPKCNKEESKHETSRSDHPFYFGSMQAFILESDDVNFVNCLVPCIVYLPIKERVLTSISPVIHLRPITRPTDSPCSLSPPVADDATSDVQESQSNDDNDEEHASNVSSNCSIQEDDYQTDT